MPTLITPADLAERLPGMTVQALATMRYQGDGPKFIKVGRRVYYSEQHIQEWMEENTHTITKATA